jgi:hypothetical protein
MAARAFQFKPRLILWPLMFVQRARKAQNSVATARQRNSRLSVLLNVLQHSLVPVVGFE